MQCAQYKLNFGQNYIFSEETIMDNISFEPSDFENFFCCEQSDNLFEEPKKKGCLKPYKAKM